MLLMKNVVITGSTRGIGLGLAEAFLKRGCAVVISGRNPEKLNKIVVSLKAKYKKAQISGCPCDVTVYEQVQRLWDQAKSDLGVINIWINNAGRGHTFAAFQNIESGEMKNVVDINLTGLLYCCQVAVKGMLRQETGTIYNMEGAGSDGHVRSGLSIYSTTKSAVHYLNRALLNELKNRPVSIAAVNPGMVVTDLLIGNLERMDPRNQEHFKKAINLLADPVDLAAYELADKILKNRKNGANIKRMSVPGMLLRFMFAGLRKRDLVAAFYEKQK